MRDEETNRRRDVLLVFQTALLGMVRPNLRAVSARWSARTIEGLLIFDGPIGDIEEETASEVETEIAASFPDHEVLVSAQRCDAPALLDLHEMQAWVYSRDES